MFQTGRHYLLSEAIDYTFAPLEDFVALMRGHRSYVDTVVDGLLQQSRTQIGRILHSTPPCELVYTGFGFEVVEVRGPIIETAC